MSVEITLARSKDPDIELRNNLETGDTYLRIRTGVRDASMMVDDEGRIRLEVCMGVEGLVALMGVLNRGLSLVSEDS